MITTEQIEFRNVIGDSPTLTPRSTKPPTIVGYAVVFDSPSSELSIRGRRFREVVKPGAFAESLADGSDVLARFEHDKILGRTSNGTLRLTEDSRGLRYEIDLPDTQLGRDLAKLIRRGDVKHSSFAFRVREGGEHWRRENAGQVRELTSVRLLDVSPVSQASYSSTTVSLRDAWRGAIDWMRDRLRLADAEIWQPASAALAGMARRLRRTEAG